MMKYSTYTWDLVRALGSASPAFWKTPATFIDVSTQTSNHKKAKNPEIWFNSQQIISYCLGLRTQNPGLREVHFERSPKLGSDKINMLKIGRKTAEENKSHHTVRTHIRTPALRELDLGPSAKRRATRTEARVSLYWTSWNLHPKEPPHQISHK